ncbi:MAG: SH3 domain-containing protein [Arachnia sp.]
MGSIVWGVSADASSGPMVATTAVNVRSTPNTSKPRVGLLRRGQKVTAVSSSNGWTRVSYRGRTAYVASAYLKSPGGSTSTAATAQSATTGTVYATANLNLRTGPSMKNSVKTVAKRGTKLSLTGSISGSYAQVSYGKSKLWAASRYLSSAGGSAPSKLPAVTGQARARVPLMIRTTDTRSFRSLGDMPAGTIVDLTGKVSNGLAQIIWQGNLRWVNNKYLDKVSSTSAAPAAGSTPKTTTRYATANLSIWAKSTGSAKSGEIPRGSAIAVTGKVASGRAEIVYQGAIKWVTSRYTSASKPAASSSTPAATSTMYATATLNLWHAATGSAYTGTVSSGTSLALTGTTASGRSQVVRNGKTWWVTSKYLSSSSTTTKASSGSNTSLNRGWSSGLDKTNEFVKVIVRYVWANVPLIKTMYGWRRSTTPDHPAGRAVDIMIPSYKANNAAGWKLATYFRTNARKYHIHYIIFDQKIWNISRDREGWRPMASRGSDTANHLDHIHITTYDS